MTNEIIIYKGFKIVFLQPHTLAAYRNEEYMKQGTASYSVTVEAEDYSEPLRRLTGIIDSMNDEGEFGRPVRLTGEEAEELMEVIKGLPFMPEPGPRMPSCIAEEIYRLEAFESPISEYGRVVVDKVSSALKDFIGTDFVVGEKFDESGWSSDGIMYNGQLRHLMTNTEWLMQISVSFEWRAPESIGLMFIDFLAVKRQDGTWADVPIEIVRSEEYSFDLNAEGGRRASAKIMELKEKVRSQDGRVE